MADTLIASGVVAVSVLGFAPQNKAMLTAGAERAFKPVMDGMVASVSGWLALFGLALGGLFLSPPWLANVAIVAALLFLALAGLTRFLADPEASEQPPKPASAALMPLQQMRSPESWAVAVFLAGSALGGSMTLAAAFAALTLMTTFGLSLWALAGWTGCDHLSSGWQRRHLDWGFGILMFVAAMTSLVSGG